MKRCSKCEVEKPETEFHKNASAKSGLSHQCKECANKRMHTWAKENPERHRENCARYRLANPEKHNAANALWEKRHPEKVRAKARRRNYRRFYSLTLPQYEALLFAQNGVCAICKQECTSGKRLAVDHIHGTNPVVVRGILCQKCNHAIGLLRDSPHLCFAAASYLQKNASSKTALADVDKYASPC